LEACSGNLESWEPSQHLLIGTGKPRKTCVEVAGRRTLRRRLWPRLLYHIFFFAFCYKGHDIQKGFTLLKRGF